MKGDCMIRKAISDDATGIGRVHVDSWRTTYKGIVTDDYLSALSYTSSTNRWRNRLEGNSERYALFVSEDDEGNIVGFADGGPERSGDSTYDGELYAIYLLQEYQRQGVGKQLFRNVAAHLSTNQFHALLIWVLVDNPSRSFYESLGGLPIRETVIEIGGERLSEIAYGWTDLDGLLATVEGR